MTDKKMVTVSDGRLEEIIEETTEYCRKEGTAYYSSVGISLRELKTSRLQQKKLQLMKRKAELLKKRKAQQEAQNAQ